MTISIKPFKYYIENNKVKKKVRNQEEGTALLKKAKARLEYVKKQILDEQSSEFIFEDAYESVREAAQSLMSLNGYKPYSHEATISFLKEFFKEFTEGELHDFDYFRRERNLAIYTGKGILKEETEEIIVFAEKFLEKVEDIWGYSKETSKV